MKADYEYENNYINITNSNFEWLNYHSEVIDDASLVSSESGMQHQALVLGVNLFLGEIRINNSTFTDNMFKYSSCKVLPESSFSYTPLNTRHIPALNFEDNLTLLSRHSSWQYDKIQLKSLISIFNHTEKLSIIDNTFKHNSGTKGIVNIEIGLQSTYSALVHNNTFE